MPIPACNRFVRQCQAFCCPALAVVLMFIGTLSFSTAATAAQEQKVSLRWATSSVGSAGHRAKINLMAVLNREMPAYDISVMPTPGAIASIRGYAMGQFDGFYGADIAFRELAENSGRFRGFQRRMQREPVQSFWAYSMEVGLAVRGGDRDAYSGWGDLNGRNLFTGPAPWDVRAQLERALAILGVKHRYRELDLGLAGMSLANGSIDGMIVYTAGESRLPSWVAEAQLATDVAVLPLTETEIATLRAGGMDVVSIEPGVFGGDADDAAVTLLPFFYGFHVGTAVPAEDLYQMLTIIEAKASELAATDAVFVQIARDMPEMQRRGVAAAVDGARVHPGLARYMRERGVWDSDWDGRVAE